MAAATTSPTSAAASPGGDGDDGQSPDPGHRPPSSTATCGYVTFVLCNVLLVIYPLWALLIARIEEDYAIYYPPGKLALYIPTYLALLFVFVPVLYMGLNMRSSPAADDIDGVWDARAHECHDSNEKCDNEQSSTSALGRGESMPAICDADVRSVNLRVRQRLGKEREEIGSDGRREENVEQIATAVHKSTA